MRPQGGLRELRRTCWHLRRRMALEHSHPSAALGAEATAGLEPRTASSTEIGIGQRSASGSVQVSKKVWQPTLPYLRRLLAYSEDGTQGRRPFHQRQWFGICASSASSGECSYDPTRFVPLFPHLVCKWPSICPPASQIEAPHDLSDSAWRRSVIESFVKAQIPDSPLSDRIGRSYHHQLLLCR